MRKERCNKCNLGSCPIDAPKCEGLEEDLQSMGQFGDRTDHYSPGYKVSIERERLIQTRMQEALDQQVADENRFDPSLSRGLPPCKRVNRVG